MKHVVIVDSGLNVIKSLQEITINACYLFQEINDHYFMRKVSLPNLEDSSGHGTSVTSVIYNYNRSTKFTLIKAFDNNDAISSQALEYILHYIDKYIKCDIINLSCGCEVAENRTGLEDICQKLRKNNVVIVSAFSNEGAITFPASFPDVIGVDYSTSCFSPSDYQFIINSYIDIRGIGYPQRLPVSEGVLQQQVGSSFVVPHIVGMLIQNLSDNLVSYQTAMLFLKQNAKEVIKFKKNRFFDKPFPIQEAVAFPYDKEMDVLLRNASFLKLCITNVLEIKYRLYQSLIRMKQINQEHLLCSLDSFNWENCTADAIIIGHVNMLSKAVGYNIKSSILEKCLKYKKNVYMFDSIENDDELISMMKLSNLHVFYPNINHFQNNNFGKLFVHNAPKLAIMGTGPKQGKFTLQVSLKNYMESIGYKICCLGSEPTSPLFNFDSYYPFGYNSAVSLCGEQAVTYINYEISELDKSNPDLIIIGSQSQSIPTSDGNIGFYNLSQYELILGVQPDIFFLCAYVNDEISYIKRTVRFLESINEAEVIGIIIFPFIYKNENGILTNTYSEASSESISNQIKEIKKSIDIPVFSFLDQTLYKKLLEAIQKKFS